MESTSGLHAPPLPPYHRPAPSTHSSHTLAPVIHSVKGAGRSSDVELFLVPASAPTGVTKVYVGCLWDGAYKIDKSSLCGGSGFPFSLSEWSLTICLTPYNRR